MNQTDLTTKETNIKYFGFSTLVAVVAYLVNTNIVEDLPRKLSESIFWLVVPIIILSTIASVLKKDTFLSWAKLTNYYFIISIIIILLTPTSTHGLDFVPIIKETMTIALASTYSVISLLLIVYKSFKK